MTTNSAIPAHPGVAAAQVAAAGGQRPSPVPTHQPNRMIPTHPQVHVQQAQAATDAQARALAQPRADGFFADEGPPGPSPHRDYFAAVGMGDDPNVGPEVPSQAPAEPQQPQTDFASDIDALLQDLPEAEQPVAQPQVQQEMPQQAQPAPTPQAPQAEPPFDAAAAQKAAIDQLMAREYAIDDADARRLISEPEAVLPRLAAQVHVNVIREVGLRVGQVIPALVQRLVTQQLEGQRSEMEFFGRYPKLAHPAFRETVRTALATVVQLNPQITREEAMQQGATLSAYMIRTKYRQNGTRPQVPPQTRSPNQPYTPIAPGAGGAPVPMRPGDQNPFAQLAGEAELFDW